MWMKKMWHLRDICYLLAVLSFEECENCSAKCFCRNQKSQYGKPGIPGSNDLETALRKLSLRRANELNEQDYREDEEKKHQGGNRYHVAW